MTRYTIVHGLRPELRSYVLQQGPTSTAALLEAAKIAEATIVTAPTVSDEILDAIRRLEMRSTAPMFASSRGQSPSPTPGTTRHCLTRNIVKPYSIQSCSNAFTPTKGRSVESQRISFFGGPLNN